MSEYSKSPAGDGASIDLLRKKLSSDAKLLEYGSVEWMNRLNAYSPQGEQMPSYIVECATEKDVVEAVKFARSMSLPLTARSGAHNLAELSNVQGGNSSCEIFISVNNLLMTFVHENYLQASSYRKVGEAKHRMMSLPKL